MSVHNIKSFIERAESRAEIQMLIRNCELSLQDKRNKILRLQNSTDPWKQLEARTLTNQVLEEMELLNAYKQQYAVAQEVTYDKIIYKSF